LNRTHAGSTVISFVKTTENKSQFVVQAARTTAEDTLADRRAFRLDVADWDEFVEILERPARPVPEFTRLLSSVGAFDADTRRAAPSNS
jgi:uncharacterized protein (DUF1778 family)